MHDTASKFTDDLSGVLGFGHSTTAGTSGPRRLSEGGIDAYLKPQRGPHHKIEQHLFDKRLRQLMGDGCTLSQARAGFRLGGAFSCSLIFSLTD